MPPYDLLHLEGVWMVLVGGALVALAIVLARASRHRTLSLRRKSEEQLEAETHDFAGAVREQNRPVPLLVWIVAVGYFVWAVAYVIFTAETGV
jgi:hypothetical protein